MSVNLNKCETCLSTDRQLICISNIQSIIKEIQALQIIDTTGQVCWECRRRIESFTSFRAQAKKAREILTKKFEHHQKSLSNLSRNSKLNFDYEFIHKDPFVSIHPNEVEIKAETKLKHEETERCSSDNDEKPLNVVFAECIKVKNGKEKSCKSKKCLKDKRIKIKRSNDEVYLKGLEGQDNQQEIKRTEEDVKEKFDTIIFTEDEMMKCREDKRRRANFKKIPFKCDLCVTGFTKEEKYELHLKKKHDKSIGDHLCNVCQMRFATVTALSRHHARHYRQYACRMCEYRAASHRAAAAHAREKHGADDEHRIHCKQCSFIASTSKDLIEHTRADHSFICNECGVKFKGRNTLRAHQIRIHAVKREFSCDTCSRTFATATRLESHVARHGAQVARLLAYCATCHTQYKNVHVYRAHLRNSRRHVQERVTCTECGKGFASRAYYTKHYSFYHLRQSRYQCRACDKLFISKWRLKVHGQTQHGLSRTREHACNVCGKTFYTKATLASHTLLHSARGFMCALCGLTFTQRAALYTHDKIIHSKINK